MAHLTKGKYFFLLVSLVALGCLYPVVERGDIGVVAWTVAFWVVLLHLSRARHVLWEPLRALPL